MDKIDNALIKHMEDKGCDGMDGIRIRTKEEEQGYIHQLQQGCNGISAHDLDLESFESKPSDRQVGGEHYKDYPIEPGEYNQRNKIGYMEGTAIKYITRHASKGGVDDIKKAIHCLELVLEWEYGVYDK